MSTDGCKQNLGGQQKWESKDGGMTCHIHLIPSSEIHFKYGKHGLQTPKKVMWNPWSKYIEIKDLCDEIYVNGAAPVSVSAAEKCPLKSHCGSHYEPEHLLDSLSGVCWLMVRVIVARRFSVSAARQYGHSPASANAYELKLPNVESFKNSLGFIFKEF